MTTRPDIKHGICKHCSRRRTLWRPADLCERCLLAAASRLSVPRSNSADTDGDGD